MTIDLQALYESCPEALAITPKHFCDHWTSVVCTAGIDRTSLASITECDWNLCEGFLSSEVQGTATLYPI